MTTLLSRLRHAAIVFSFSIACCVTAEEKKEPIADYKSAHNSLIALGLPALNAEAKWVTLQGQHHNFSHHLRERIDIKSKGSHWLFTTTEGSFSLPRGMIQPDKLSTEAAKAKPKEANLKEDIVSIQKSLKKFKSQPSEELTNAFTYYDASKNLANIIIFACQLRQAGHPDAANLITHEVLNISPSHKESIIDEAISHIAESQHQQITDQFTKDHNWNTYHESLRSLMSRFPRGWSNADAIALCLEPTAQRAKGIIPAISSLKDPADAKLVEALLLPPSSEKPADDENTFHGVDLREYPAHQRDAIKARILAMVEQGITLPSSNSQNHLPDLWLLEPVKASENSSAIQKILSKGIHALPILAAIAEDTTLTHIFSDSNSSHTSYHFSSGSTTSAEELYASLHRPMSRGEIATQLLTNTLPDASNDNSSLPAADVAQMALEFWNSHKDKKDWEIAIPFLDGDTNQRQQALSLLSQSKNPSALSLFKKSILTGSLGRYDIDIAVEFIRANPEKDPQFIKDFRATLKKVADSPPQRNEYYQSRSDYSETINTIIKKLDSISSRKSVDDMIAEIHAAPPSEASTSVESLVELLEDKPDTDTLMLLLNNAVNAKDATIATAFLTGSYKLEFDEDATERKLAEPERELWKKLLADTRALPADEEDDEEQESANTISAVASIALCYTHSQQDYHTAHEWAPILKKTLLEILRERATAIINRQPLTPWPDSEKVSEKRLKEIVKSIENKPPNEIISIVEKFTLDETAAWIHWLEEPGDLPHPESLSQLKFFVSNRDDSYKSYFKDEPQIDQLTLPFLITADSLIKWLDTLSSKMTEQSGSTIIISRNRASRMELSIASGKFRMPVSAENDEGKKQTNERFDDYFQHFLGSAYETLTEDDKADAVMCVTFRSQQRGNSRLDLAATLDEGKITKSDEFTKEAIAEFLSSSAEAGLESPIYLQIQILNREDFTKFQNYFDNEEEEEDE